MSRGGLSTMRTRGNVEWVRREALVKTCDGPFDAVDSLMRQLPECRNCVFLLIDCRWARSRE